MTWAAWGSQITWDWRSVSWYGYIRSDVFSRDDAMESEDSRQSPFATVLERPNTGVLVFSQVEFDIQPVSNSTCEKTRTSA